MKKDNYWKIYGLSWERCFIILFVYFFLFQFIFPQIAYRIQLADTNFNIGELKVKYQMLVYIASVIPCILTMIPLLKSEKKININKLLVSIITVIVSGLLLNLIFSFIVTWFNGSYLTSENQAGLNELAIQNKYFFLTMTIILAPILEELVFRGVLFRGLRGRMGFLVPAMFSSLMFGFIHVFSSLLEGSMIDFFYLFLYSGLGFLFCIIYEYNKSIYACIIVHIFYNLYASMNLILS